MKTTAPQGGSNLSGHLQNKLLGEAAKKIYKDYFEPVPGTTPESYAALEEEAYNLGRPDFLNQYDVGTANDMWVPGDPITPETQGIYPGFDGGAYSAEGVTGAPMPGAVESMPMGISPDAGINFAPEAAAISEEAAALAPEATGLFGAGAEGAGAGLLGAEGAGAGLLGEAAGVSFAPEAAALTADLAAAAPTIAGEGALATVGATNAWNPVGMAALAAIGLKTLFG